MSKPIDQVIYLVSPDDPFSCPMDGTRTTAISQWLGVDSSKQYLEQCPHCLDSFIFEIEKE